MAKRYKLIRRRKWRKYKKHYQKRRKGAGRYTTFVPKGNGPVSSRCITTLQWVEDFTRTITGPDTDDYRFYLNDIWDVNGGTHQPYGYDQYAALYTRYRVISAHYRIVYGGNSVASSFVGACVNIQNTDYSGQSLGQLTEKKGAFMKGLDPTGVTVVKGRCNMPKVFGVTKAKYIAGDEYDADIAGSPALDVVLHSFICNKSTTALLEYKMFVQIFFKVEFFSPTVFGQS